MNQTSFFALLILFASACHTTKPSNISPKCVEKIDPDCMCVDLMVPDPVCGCNNKTYSDACVAECAGIMTYTKGKCPEKAALSLEAKVWQLTAFTGGANPQTVPKKVTITLKFEGGKLNGHGGCNNLGGAYVLDGKRLTISGLVSTKMYCENTMNWETRFIQQLEKSNSFSVNNETLEINCGDLGNLTFRLNWKKRKE